MRRKFQIFCIGSGKTGTTTVADMFRHYRSQHEPIPALTNQIVIDVDRGNIHPAIGVKLLRQRDADLYLEVDSSHPLGMIPEVLDRAFPTAKYIVTIRNPVDWIRSRIKYHYAVDPPSWRPFRQHFWWNKHGDWDYTSEDDYLYHTYSLCSVSMYYEAYGRQYSRICNEIFADRMLVIRTEDLSTPVGKSRLAGLVGLPPSSLTPAHSNKNLFMMDPSGKLSDAWLLEQSQELCPTAWRMWHEC